MWAQLIRCFLPDYGFYASSADGRPRGYFSKCSKTGKTQALSTESQKTTGQIKIIKIASRIFSWKANHISRIKQIFQWLKLTPGSNLSPETQLRCSDWGSFLPNWMLNRLHLIQPLLYWNGMFWAFSWSPVKELIACQNDGVTAWPSKIGSNE